jgi:hypothetical protein
MESAITLLLCIIALIAALIIYFLPTIIASGRNSAATFLIFLINLFTGWTVALWLFVLIWAFCGKTKDDAK